MLKKTLRGIITFLFLVGILGASSLVYDEFIVGHICPKILGIPACYIIMLCLIIPLGVHLLIPRKTGYYFLGISIALSIASYGSIMQILGIAECPKTSNGTPMCFLSFLIFISLFLLKKIEYQVVRSPK
ncbi:MAG: hypothetical protein ACRBFS_08955 [Aureispira sp.]